MNQCPGFSETASMLQVGSPEIHLQVRLEGGVCGSRVSHQQAEHCAAELHPSVQVHLLKGRVVKVILKLSELTGGGF